ncbi:uncharacterized protein LOC120147290 [Hibiscus syriacus]|uniref:uncharacterized protein LOC120147290 n=1 Tax=Hibiscus syriacus TaxID=106335 RepID=UPI001924FB4F|nr:uncharacterized protein LOC120147290 [Hibiscus syriacus]
MLYFPTLQYLITNALSCSIVLTKNTVMSSLPLVPLFPCSMRSMSVNIYVPFHVPVTTSNPVIKQANKIVMLKHDQVPGKQAHIHLIGSFSKNNVFKDQSQGVICYRDGNGEIVCEGYDEGPHFRQGVLGTTYHPRDAEILDLLQNRWLQIVNVGGLSSCN